MNSRFRWIYVLAFAGAICGVVFLSLPDEETRIGMSGDDGDRGHVEQLLRRRFERDRTDAETALRLIDAALANANPALAEETARIALGHHPGDVRFMRRLAERELGRGDLEAAFAILPEKERDRSFLLAATELARTRGDLVLAETLLLAAERERLDQPDVWLTLAEWRSGRFDTAGEAQALEQALQRDPNNQAAWKRYFLNRVWSLDAEGAMRAAARLEAFGPLDRGSLDLLYTFQIARGDIAASAVTLEKLAAAPDARPADGVRLASLLYNRNDAARADALLLKLLAAPGSTLERWERDNAMAQLRVSALATNNLDLALALAALPAEAGAKRQNRMVALEVALTSGRPEKAEELLRAELALPDAPVDVVLAGLELAYRRERFADLPALLERLEKAPNPAGVETGVEAFLYAALDDDTTLDAWRAETRRRPDSVVAWTGLSRTALRAAAAANVAAAATAADANAAAASGADANLAEVVAATDAALSRLETVNVPGLFALLEAAAFLAETLPAGSPEQAEWARRAAALADRGVNGPLAKSGVFLAMAADAYERERRLDEAGAVRSRLAVLRPADQWNRIGLARLATDRADEAAAEAQLAALAEGGAGNAPDVLRARVYACLGMADALNRVGGERASRAAVWVARAETLFREHAALLPLEEVENASLAADIAERAGDWPGAQKAWEAVLAKTPANAAAWLGLARSALAGKDAEAAWRALERARRIGVTEADLRLQMATQYLAAAEALPEDAPSRPERLASAEQYAWEVLAARWDVDVATTLFYRAMAENRMEKAEALLARMDNPPPEMHAAMAEAISARLNENAGGEGRQAEGRRADGQRAEGQRTEGRQAAGGQKAEEWNSETREAMRVRAVAEADAALRSNDAAVLLRLAFVFQTTNEKERLRTLLARIGTAPITPDEAGGERLRQLSDAYGFLGDQERQFALIEERARLGGGLPAWLDAADRRVWAGDYAGALSLLDEAEAGHPGAVELLDRRLTILADDNRPGQVVAEFQKARSRDGTVEERLSADALAALGVAHDDLRAAPAARRFLRLSLEKGPANKRGSMGAARLLQRDGDLGGAVRLLRLYVEGTPDDPWGWLALADTRAQSNQIGRAEYLKVVELTEPDAEGNIPTDVRAARAAALRRLGREKEARALLAETLGPTITDPDVACDFAQMLMDIGKYEEAVDILRRTAQAFPNHVWAYRLEATILVRWRKYDAAVARLREALVWSPEDGEVQRDLGFAAQLWERTWASQKGWLSAGGR